MSNAATMSHPDPRPLRAKAPGGPLSGRLGVPGEELEKVLYDIAEMEGFRGRRVLVVGGGDSAVESALGLANQAGTTVTLSYRGDQFARIKERNREKLEAASAAARVRVVLRSQVR